MQSAAKPQESPGTSPKAAAQQQPAGTIDYDPNADAIPHAPIDYTRVGVTAVFADHGSTEELNGSGPRLTQVDVGPAFGEFGNYELLNEIARGGMGVVFKARQKSLNRIVAVKMILAGQMASPMAVQRFYAEAQAAANLHHPGIVGIYEVGELDGRHYFSMEFVEGQSLADKIRDKPLPPADAARYMIQIAEAIDYAHERSILHRDLKPSNVLIDLTDRPRVTDFGLAKQLEGATQLTGADTLLGTPSYMPPEQAAAKHGQVNRTSDVYSLGAVLYELLTGRPPFVAAQPIDIIMQVLRTDPVAPRLLNSKLPVDLETIALKCLTKEQSKRYPTAGELAADLKRWQDGEPILARPTGQAERLFRWCRRNPRVAALSGISLALVVAIAVISTVSAIQIRAARDRAVKNLIAEEAAKKSAEQNARIARTVIENLVASFADTMTDTGAMSEVQRRILEDARQVYEDFLRVEPTDMNLKFEAALARRKLGDIARLQGRPEDFAAAEADYRDSIRRFGELVQTDPANSMAKRELAEGWNWLGELLRPTERRADAEAAYRTALELQTELATDFSDAANYKSDVGRSRYNLGILHRDAGDFAAALSDFEAAIESFRTLVAKYPDRDDFRHGLARSLDNLGTLFVRKREPAKAQAAYRDAIGSFQMLHQQQSKKPEYRHELAGSLMNLSNQLAADPKHLDEAESACRQAKSLFEGLAKEFRVRTVYRNDVAKAWASLGQIEWKRGNRPAAKDCWTAAVNGFRELVAEQPNVTDNKSRLGGSLDNLAYWHVAVKSDGEKSKAATFLTEAEQCLRTALMENPRDPKTRDQLLRHAQILLMLGDHRAASRSVEPLMNPMGSSSAELEGLTRIFSRCLDAIGKSSEPLDLRGRFEREYAAAAAKSFQRLVAVDGGKLALLNGKDFSTLRNRPELAGFVAKASAAGRP